MSFNIPYSNFLNQGLNPTGLSPRGSIAQNVNVTDLVCEGPIRGLVNGEAGVHLDDVSVQDANFVQYTSYQPPEDGQQTFSGDITFSGTTVGTLSDELDISDLELDENSPRSITLQNYKTTSVTVTTSTETNGATTLSLAAASGSPFTNDWNSGQQLSDNAFAIVSLVQDDFSTIGYFYISSGTTAGFIVYGVVPPTTGTFTLVVDYVIPITAIDSNNNQITLAATPASGSYKFVIGAQTTIDDNGEVSAGLSSIVGKIHKLNIDFRKGDLYQPVTRSTGGVGGSVAVTGNTSLISGPADLKIINQTLADSLGVDILDKNGLPNIGGGKEYPGTPDFDVMAEFVTTLPSSSFGLDTAVKIREADEIGFSIKYPALQVINLEKGDKETAYAFYVMQIRFEQNGSYGSWKSLFPGQKYIKHYGNTSAAVSFDHDINLEGYRSIVGSFEDFEVRVFRVTRHLGLPVRSSGTNEDDTNKKKWQLSASATIDNLRAVIKDHFTYPYSAVASVSFSSRQFDGVPKRSYLLEGKLVKVPSTYTPREYSDTGIAKYEGFWDGEFRDTLFYTDNPAWVFYDIVTNNRYGAGKWLQETDIDKYALYRVARYCDELVNDGSEYDSDSPLVIGQFYRIKTAGTTTWTSLGAADSNVDTVFRATSKTITGTGVACRVEPRFRANVFLTKATDVYKVLKDFATIFLGILYWQDSKVVAVQDAPQDPIYNFTKGNVIDGAFSYESSGSRTRTNQVVVTWNDPTINYQPVPLVVEDRESIVRSGRIISENVVAFGATSESQAIRYGKWKLWTAQNQTEIISFKTSLAAHYIKPGDIINVQDADRFGISYSGRTSSATSTTITFDRNVTFTSGSTYTLSTLVTAPAALNASDGSITVNLVTYERGERIDQAYVYDGSSYELVDLDTEERASNAFTDSSGTELIPTIWKPYTYVETHEITNPGSTTNTVTLANSATFDTTPSKHNIWTLKETSGNLNVAGSQKMYKVLSIAEESPNIFGVSAVEYYDEKFTAIEEDYNLGILPGSIYNEIEPALVPAPKNLRVILATDAKKAGEEFILEWDQEDSDLISQYEVLHNIEGLESPIKTSARQVLFNNVPNGSVNLKVRGISRKGNVSSFVGINYGVYDPYGTNIDRVQYGIPKGAITNSEAGITGSAGSESFTFAKTNPIIASNGAKEVLITPNENSQDISDIPADENYYVFLDADTPTLKLMYYDTESLENMPFWRDAGTGNSASSTSWTSIGSVSIPANSNRVTGTGFNTNVELRDILNLSGSTSPTTPVGEGAVVVSIISDTELVIDRTFDTAISSTTAYRANYRPDYEEDAAIARVHKDSSNVFTTERFLTVDPEFGASKSVVLDVDVQTLTYDSASSQTNTPSNINATITAIGYEEPEFKIVIPAGMSAAGTEDFAVSTESDTLQKSFVLDNDGAITYNSGSNLTIEASVREKNNPDSVKTTSFTITKSKDGTDGADGLDGADGADGSAGINARSVDLTAGTIVFNYAEDGSTPSPSSTAITANANNTSGTVYYNFFLNNSSVQHTTSNTYTYTPQSSLSSMPDEVEVEIREGATTNDILARDHITLGGIRPGADGVDGVDGGDGVDAITTFYDNQSHTVPVTNTGVETWTGSGGTLNVFDGTTELVLNSNTQSTSYPSTNGRYNLNLTKVSGDTLNEPSITGSGSVGATLGDFSGNLTQATQYELSIYAKTSDGTQYNPKFKISISPSNQGADGGDGTNGTDGNDGNSVAQLFCYRRATSTPSTPTGGSFNFTSNTLTAPSGWTAAVPTGSDPVYISFASASINGTTGTDSSLTWSTPVLAFQDGADGDDGNPGADGGDGLSTFQGVVFRRSSSALSAPTGGSFNFGTNTFTAPTGWSTAIPSGSDPVYASRALFQITGDTGTDSSPTWSTPEVLAQDGSDGTDGTNGTDGTDGTDGISTFAFGVFQRSASAPSTPSGGSYNFGTQTVTAPSGWSAEPPATNGNPLYQSRTVASISGTTGTDSSLTWSTPVKLVEDGADGADGDDGADGADGADGDSGFFFFTRTGTGTGTGTAGVDLGPPSSSELSSATSGQIAVVQNANGVQQGWRYNGSSWVAQKIVNEEIIFANAIGAEQLLISNTTEASAGIFMNYNGGNPKITIHDGTNLRVKIGYLA